MLKEDTLVPIVLVLVVVLANALTDSPIKLEFKKKAALEAALEEKEARKERALERRANATSVYYRCLNHNIDKMDLSARAQAHCRDLRREAATLD